MIKREVTVINKLGLHARPAALFVQMANKFKADIFVEKEMKKVNAKSIMGIMSLGIAKGDTMTVAVDGLDENEALEALVELVEKTLINM